MTFKEEKIPIETKDLSKTPEYPPLKEKAKPISLTPISGLEQLNVDLMKLKQVRPVRMNATITPVWNDKKWPLIKYSLT